VVGSGQALRKAENQRRSEKMKLVGKKWSEVVGVLRETEMMGHAG
jgi:hypothetical protein